MIYYLEDVDCVFRSLDARSAYDCKPNREQKQENRRDANSKDSLLESEGEVKLRTIDARAKLLISKYIARRVHVVRCA
jgi:hypothetical protein